MSKLRIDRKISSVGESAASTFVVIIGTAIRVFGVLMVVSGLLIALGQVFSYMQSHTWTRMPVLLLSDFLPGGFRAWLHHPRSWFDLHRIVLLVLESVPASVFLILFGAIAWWVGRGMRDAKS